MSKEEMYDSNNEPIVIHKSVLDAFFNKGKHSSETLLLYLFYYYTAKWQKTNQPKANITYVMKGLHWSGEKVRKHKKILKKMQLISDGITQDKKGKISGHYVFVKFIWSKKKITKALKRLETNNETDNSTKQPSSIENHSMAEPQYGEKTTNALSTNSSNALSTDKEEEKKNIKKEKYVTSHLFDKFWQLYPKRPNSSKSKAIISWDKICKLSTNRGNITRPKWKEIKKAIKAQKNSDRWIKQPNLIPHHATWLNQARWLDDATSLGIIEDYSAPKKLNNTFNNNTYEFQSKQIEI